jgi:chromosome segregation ATPase|tara:strand:+ start:651 stop:1556 length:906 start_codon:yes stop_codon:yes gene_type:complete
MAEEKMVDLDTTGESQEVELQEEESTKEEKVQEEKVEVASEEKTEEPKDEEEAKDDGLDKYSKNVQRRIKKLLDRIEKSEQREAEALKFAESAKQKIQETESRLNSLDENYVSEYETRVKSQIEQAKKALADARINNDVNAEVEAQRSLTRLAIEEERAIVSKEQREKSIKQAQEKPTSNQTEQTPPPRQPDPRAEEWAKENEWFGQDEAMTFTALAHHKKLLGEGYDPKSDDYYSEINEYMKQQFPQKFEKEIKRKAPQTVAGASRTGKTSGSKKVKLTASQVAIAKKLGLTLEQYAKYV